MTAKILIQNLTRLEAIQKEIEEKKALLADAHLDEAQKKEARTALTALELRLRPIRLAGQKVRGAFPQS